MLMLANFHTHTTFSDGDNTVEEVVLYAIEKGFGSLGISDHGFTPFDTSYCLTDTIEYVNNINRLKAKYSGKIELYLGLEEDAFAKSDRALFDYIIGSCHYVFKDGVYHPVDSGEERFKEVLSAFDNSPIAFAENYYSNFVNYIKSRKPDIIGHFDLITKFEESLPLFLNNDDYKKLSEKFLLEALKTNSIFEINTGAISRGYRKTPYPSEHLLYTLKKQGGKVMLSSDSHNKNTLDYEFEMVKTLLKDIGFKCVYTLSGGSFVKENI